MPIRSVSRVSCAPYINAPYIHAYPFGVSHIQVSHIIMLVHSVSRIPECLTYPSAYSFGVPHNHAYSFGVMLPIVSHNHAYSFGVMPPNVSPIQASHISIQCLISKCLTIHCPISNRVDDKLVRQIIEMLGYNIGINALVRACQAR